ncbi:hypothetical protein ROA7450_03055 [Roseovarius albus]|uniref:Tetratricopeptide repeat protein n=1 Tax=Roseovarius albus TaxID=1247867 RepID=A0A1X6ZRN1_9RHOB|nr:hypothetical protein ROA7450_03055 [Roseovarius albus]
MGKILCRCLCAVVLIGAVVNFAAVFKTSPAFNSEVRAESVFGGWRVPNAAAHYDRSEYMLELGYTYLFEIGTTYDPVTGEPGIISIEELDARAHKAQDLIKQSLRLDPANASGWVYLAQAQGRISEIEAMRNSLERSWELAPNNVQLAPLRLQLVMQIYQTSMHAPEQVVALSDQEIASARQDVLILREQSPRYLESLIPESDPVRALLDDLGHANSSS